MHLILPLVATLLAPQVDDPPKIGAHLKGGIAFKWSAQRLNGQNHVLGIHAIVFRYVDVATGKVGHRAVVLRDDSEALPAGTIAVPFADAVKGIPPGRWHLSVRLENALRTTSPFSEPIEVEVIVPSRLKAVTNVRPYFGDFEEPGETDGT